MTHSRETHSPEPHSQETHAKKRVLFVCIENSNRSQIAQAFAALLGGEQVEAYSAGSRPSGVINPKAIRAMSELDYDLTSHQSTSLDALPDIPFDFVATMGCGDECPFVKAAKREDWQIPDPRDMSWDEYLDVRELIRRKVDAMLSDLGVAVRDL
ncbi:MAG: arsenate reductase ArsC [bacterium]